MCKHNSMYSSTSTYNTVRDIFTGKQIKARQQGID